MYLKGKALTSLTNVWIEKFMVNHQTITKSTNSIKKLHYTVATYVLTARSVETQNIALLNPPVFPAKVFIIKVFTQNRT